MKKNLLIILAALTLASCGCSKRLPTKTDSSVRVVEHTTLVPYVATLTIPEIKETTRTKASSSHLENEFASSDAVIHPDGTLEHTLATKSQQRPVDIDVPYTVRDSIRVETIQETIEVPVPAKLTLWQRFRLAAFWWLVLAVAAAAVWIFVVPRFIPRI